MKPRWYSAIGIIVLASVSCSSQRGDDGLTLVRHDDRLEMLKLKSQCQEAGEKARAEWIARFHAEQFSDDPEYAYNDSLNTCLYADSYTDSKNQIVHLGGGNTVEVRFVLDVYTNKTLFEYTAYDGKAIEGSPSEAEFAAVKRHLMGGPPSAQGMP